MLPLIWFVIGLVLGTILSFWAGALALDAPPDLGFDSIDFAAFVGVVAALPFGLAGAAVVLLAIRLAKSDRWRPRGAVLCVLLGMAAPLAATVIGDLAVYLFEPKSALLVAWERNPAFWAILYAAVATIAGFGLTRSDETAPTGQRPKWRAEAIGRLALAVICFACVPAHGELEELIDVQRQKIYELKLVNYQPTLAKIANWVKANFPAPSVNHDFQLPGQFPTLPDGRRVQAIVLRNGQLLLLITLYQETSLSDGGPAIAYVTSPLMPRQIGKDGDGRSIIKIKGVWAHHVTEQLSPCLYRIELNDDPDIN